MCETIAESEIILVMLFCLWLFHDINVLTHEIEACTIHFCMKLGELSGYWNLKNNQSINQLPIKFHSLYA